MSDEIIGSEYTDGKDKVKVFLSKFNGKDLIHIRKFYEKDGEWKHGKGITIKPDNLGTVIEGLQKLYETL